MPIVGNKYWNNPEIGAAFSNLAQAFAPPTAQDSAAYAAARLARDKADRAAAFWTTAKDPNVTRDTLDRLGVGSGAFSPNQSYYGVDQDVAAKRYGADRTFDASRLNNTADNARALQQTGMQQTGETARTMLAPVGEGATRFVPPALASMFGVPAQQMGVVKAGEGDTVVTPGGQTIMGTPKARSEEQVRGANLQGLIDAGKITPDMQVQNYVGKEAPVQVIGPDGKPAYMSPGAAVVAGARPYNKPINETATELEKLIQARDALPPGDPNRQAYDARIQALGRGQQQSAYDKSNDENLAGLNESIYKGAVGAIGDRNTLSILRQAVTDPNVNQGAFGPMHVALTKTLNAFGMPAGSTAPAEMINALGNQLALRLRDPSNGAGMPGSLSDSDRQFLQSMTVSLGNSPEANKRLVDYYLKIQEKNLDLDQMRQEYVQQHGRIDEGFRTQVGQYLQKFGLPPADGSAPAAAPAPAAASPNVTAPAAPASAPSGPVRVNTPEEARKLPPGTPIILPDGRQGRVP